MATGKGWGEGHFGERMGGEIGNGGGRERLETEGWSWFRMRNMDNIRACSLILGKKGIRTRGRLKLF